MSIFSALANAASAGLRARAAEKDAKKRARQQPGCTPCAAAASVEKYRADVQQQHREAMRGRR